MSTGALSQRSEAVRHAILEATVELLLDEGPDITVDNVAERANVGRRTIFRYFATKDDLFADALRTLFRNLLDAIPQRDGREVSEWLEDVARVVHTYNLRMAPTYLEIVRRRSEIPGVRQMLDSPGRPPRRRRVEVLANEAWSASGGRGRVPRIVGDSFLLHLSVFASEALRLHCRHDVDEMARLTVTTLLALIHEQKAEARRRTKARQNARGGED